MKIKNLIKKLQKFDPEAEVLISETASKNVHEISDVFCGWFIDNEFDAPEVISDKENPENYDIDASQPKVVCIE
jgi:hypothetical protein